MSKEIMSRLKRLPNSATYIKPDVTKEFSNFVLLLDLVDQSLFQMNFQDRPQFKRFFRVCYHSEYACYFGIRGIIPRPHMTLSGTMWESSMEDLYENLPIVSPAYETETYPILRHPTQRLYRSLATSVANNIRIVHFDVKHGSAVRMTALAFTVARELTCAAVECVRIYVYCRLSFFRERCPPVTAQALIPRCRVGRLSQESYKITTQVSVSI